MVKGSKPKPVCLEEGAHEFILKPLQQSDVKKLRCHMMKFKGGYAWEGGRPTTSPGQPTRGQKVQAKLLVGLPRKVVSQMSGIQLCGEKQENVTQKREKPTF
ncbi:hypothetical protein HYC85_029953 [Camellia sinensis]|uniref:Response regulatory domain-containing protein n=1 Tax=Camellia sinensis TaxID=4442 RepID=A0A7J7FZE0_CAMSI|nr:hypothetical protein HYC85_029953 [Camellia sinensis]